MQRLILIDAVYPEETRVAIVENGKLQDFDYETAAKKQLKGNIYLAKVTRVEPSLQAAFVDYGGDKHGFLPFAEIHPDYYNIPISDREKASDNEAVLNNDSQEGSNISIDDLGLKIKAITPPDLSQLDNEILYLSIDPLTSSEATSDNHGNTETFNNSSDNSDANSDSGMPIFDRIGNITEIQEDNFEGSIETLVDDDVDEAISVKSNLYRQYKIQEVIRRGQIILVQVIKEERGNKGVSLTSYISLAGRYCVLMPNSEREGGISRRIINAEDRKRLKTIIGNLELPQGISVIVRTAGCDRSVAEIKRDYDYLVRLWNNIREFTLTSTAPAFIHAESDLLKRSIRDLYDDSINEIMIQGEKAYGQIKDFVKILMPTHTNKVKHYKNKTPILCRYQVEEQLMSFFSQTVSLESGGYIVINPTEALISIDVNSGRATSERNIEETAFKTNLEAAYEIARQIRLRDISGLIVIDFIDMAEHRNRRAVERAMKDALKSDRARIQIGNISPFGLLEMSRQRLRSSFVETNSITCSHCTGKGYVKAPEATAVMMLRAIESEIYKGDYEQVNIYAATETIIYVLNNKRKDLGEIEVKYNTIISMHQDHESTIDSFSIEKIRRTHSKKIETASVAVVNNYELYPDAEDYKDYEANNDLAEKSEAKQVISSDEGNFYNNNSAKDSYQEEGDCTPRKGRKKYPGKRSGRKFNKNYDTQEPSFELEEALETVSSSNISGPKTSSRSTNRKASGKRSYKVKGVAQMDSNKSNSESLIKGFLRRILE